MMRWGVVLALLGLVACDTVEIPTVAVTQGVFVVPVNTRGELAAVESRTVARTREGWSQAAIIRLVGQPLLGIRLASAFIGMLSIAISYRLVRALLGSDTRAAGVALLTAEYPERLGEPGGDLFGRLGGEVGGFERENPFGVDGMNRSFTTKCSQCHSQIHGTDLPSQSLSGGGRGMVR